MTEDIVVRRVKLPSGVNGCVTTSPDGWNNVYINEDLSQEQQIKTLEHEIEHIEQGHFYSDEDFASLEANMPGEKLFDCERRSNLVFASYAKGAKNELHPDDVRAIQEIIAGCQNRKK